MSDRSPVRRSPVRVRVQVAALAAVALLVGACGGEADSSQAAPEEKPAERSVETIKVGIVPATTAVLLWTAQEQGYFEEQDLVVELQPANGGPATVPALQSGAIQVGQAAILNAVQAEAAGLDIPCFLGNARLGPDGALLPLVASKKSEVRDAADLVGKKVAVNALGSTQQLVASAYLESEGVDPDDVQFVTVEIPAAAAALVSGQVDAAILTAPFSNIALSQGGVMVSAHPEQAIDAHLSFACYIATRDWLEGNPDVVERFTTALGKAHEYVEANPGYDIDVIAKNLDSDPALFEGGMPEVGPELSTGDIEEWIELGKQYGAIEGEVDAAAVIHQ